MATINLENDWTFRSPVKTIRFTAGKHMVDDDVHEAAVAAGVIADKKGKTDGDGNSKAGPPSAADAAQG